MKLREGSLAAVLSTEIGSLLVWRGLGAGAVGAGEGQPPQLALAPLPRVGRDLVQRVVEEEAVSCAQTSEETLQQRQVRRCPRHSPYYTLYFSFGV